jgi:hypothetical protein
MVFPFRIGRRKKVKAKVDKKELDEAIAKELAPYITREELIGYLQKIQSDDKKKKLWESLSPRTKIKFLKYMAGKKGGSGGGDKASK